jgi:hypothetical protein
VKVFTCNQEFFDKWGSFYDELKLDKGFWSSQFYFFYFTRRLGYLLFQVYLNNNLFLQGALNILLSLLTLVYLLKFMPFKEKVLMATTLLGEVCVNLVFGFSYAFVFGISEKIKAILELCIIFTVIFGIAGQFLIAFYLFFKGIIELWIKLEKARALQFADTAKKTIPELIENSIEEKRSESDRLSNLAEHISK